MYDNVYFYLWLLEHLNRSIFVFLGIFMVNFLTIVRKFPQLDRLIAPETLYILKFPENCWSHYCNADYIKYVSEKYSFKCIRCCFCNVKGIEGKVTGNKEKICMIIVLRYIGILFLDAILKSLLKNCYFNKYVET